MSAVYGAVVAAAAAAAAAAALWEKEAEPWETTGATEPLYIPGPGCPPCALLPTDPEGTTEP